MSGFASNGLLSGGSRFTGTFIVFTPLRRSAANCDTVNLGPPVGSRHRTPGGKRSGRT